MNTSMNLDEMMQAVRECAQRMDSLYGETVFDEWVVVSLQPTQPRILNYFGPRNYEFRQNFTRDLGDFARSALARGSQPGRFRIRPPCDGHVF